MAIRIPRPRRKRRAGERAGLSKDKIIAAATRLYEQTQALSLRALAKALGVVPTTIKSHFKGGASEITAAIARAAIARLARPYRPQEPPAEYLGDVFMGFLERLKDHPMVARLVVIELSSNPLLDPFLAERILLCVQELGAKPEYLPRGLRRVIGGLSDMILTESAQSGEIRQKVLAELITHCVARLAANEFSMLTENSKSIADHYGKVAGLSPVVARDYAAAVIGRLEAEIKQARRPRERARRP
jgi:AcrR family transcriptional regulator